MAPLNFSNFSYETYQSLKQQYDMMWHQNRSSYLSHTGAGEQAYRQHWPFLQPGSRQRKGWRQFTGWGQCFESSSVLFLLVGWQEGTVMAFGL